MTSKESNLPVLRASAGKRPPSRDEKYETMKAEAVRARDSGKDPWISKNAERKKKGWQPSPKEKPEGVEGAFAPGEALDLSPAGELPYFDPEMIPDDAVIVAFGKRRTGKSFLLRDLLYQKRHVFNHGLVITKTKFNGFWQNYFPMNVVHGNYDPSIIENFMKLQLDIMSENEKNPSHKKINPWAVIILDDVIADKHVRYDDTLATLFYNGRHFKICVMIASQYVFGLPPGLRGNADFAMCFKQVQKRQRDQLAEDYGDMIYDKDVFFNVLDVNTRDRHVMITDLSDPNKPLNETYFRYKAVEVPLFEIGSLEWKRQVWTDQEKRLKDPYTMN